MLEVTNSPLTRFAQEAERRRIARELHDGVVQSLTALVADLDYFRTYQLATNRENGKASQDVASKLETWQELARDSLTSMRQTLGGLRTQGNLDLGLETSVQSLLNELRDANYTVTCEYTDWPSMLPFEYTSNLYCIIREALTNIRKHAQASHVTLFLFSHEGRLHMSIGDNGVGIHAEGHAEGRTEIHTASVTTLVRSGWQQGLIGLRERTQHLSGRLTIESSQGKGTRVDIDVPLP